MDCDDTECVERVVLPADRDVLARQESMPAELVAGLIVVILSRIVGEYPARMFGATRLVSKMADLFVFAGPKSSNPASSGCHCQNSTRRTTIARRPATTP